MALIDEQVEVPVIEEEEGAASTLPRIEPERGVFITRSEIELPMRGRGITALVLERVTNEGKPRIPMVEVIIGGKHKQIEPNPNDPNYVQKLEEWKAEANPRLLRYLVLNGVGDVDIPVEFVEDNREFFPDATDRDMKYLYVVSLIPDDDIEIFMDAIMGQYRPTAKGLNQAAKSFRSDS